MVGAIKFLVLGTVLFGVNAKKMEKSIQFGGKIHADIQGLTAGFMGPQGFPGVPMHQGPPPMPFMGQQQPPMPFMGQQQPPMPFMGQQQPPMMAYHHYKRIPPVMRFENRQTDPVVEEPIRSNEVLPVEPQSETVEVPAENQEKPNNKKGKRIVKSYEMTAHGTATVGKGKNKTIVDIESRNDIKQTLTLKFRKALTGEERQPRFFRPNMQAKYFVPQTHEEYRSPPFMRPLHQNFDRPYPHHFGDHQRQFWRPKQPRQDLNDVSGDIDFNGKFTVSVDDLSQENVEQPQYPQPLRWVNPMQRPWHQKIAAMSTLHRNEGHTEHAEHALCGKGMNHHHRGQYPNKEESDNKVEPEVEKVEPTGGEDANGGSELVAIVAIPSAPSHRFEVKPEPTVE